MRRLSRKKTTLQNGRPQRRAGVATLDYVLVLGIILPLALIVIPVGMRMISLVYDMIAVNVSWPFM
jgi:hypothetical protein